VRDVPVVFVTAGRLLVRHWPALLTLALLAAAARNGALWAAVVVSDRQGQLAQLLLMLAPVGYLLPLIGMLVVCRRSLPALRRVDDQDDFAVTEGRRLRLVDVAVSVLIPFLVVYQSYGLLDQDIARFRNTAAAEEYFGSISFLKDIDTDFQDRLGIYPLPIAVAIVVVAAAVRFLLGRVERVVHFVGIAFVGALVELYYTTQLAAQFVVLRVNGMAWVRDRRAARWVESGYDAVVDVLGPVAGAFRWLVHGVETIAGSLDVLVVAPLGWLALGAVVLGFQLTGAPQDAERPDGLWRGLLADLRERYSALIQGLRLIWTAGLAPMLVYLLAFITVVNLPALVLDLTRVLLGPHEFSTSVALSPAEIAVSYAVSLTLTAPLLAAAVDWLVRTRAATRSPEVPTSPTPA
jgi:hypothetical protein